MLVLTRRLNEKICLPGINTSIQVVAVKPGIVRLGIDAPPEVEIRREEVLRSTFGQWRPQPKSDGRMASVKDSSLSLTCERLKGVSIQLGLARLQLQAGHTDDAQEILDTIHQDIQDWRKQLDGENSTVGFTPKVPPLPIPVDEESFADCELLAPCLG